MHSIVGEIRNIHRYPVKSFAGEPLETCKIEPYGLLGDRYCCFYDETKKGWKRYITARNIPKMLSYQAHYINEEIHVTAADGRKFDWDATLLEAIQSHTKTPISMSQIKDPHPQPELSQLFSVDEASILLITDASLKRLEAEWGHAVDHRRFRGNLVIALHDDSLFEGDWIGHRLKIGDVELQVDSTCERCVVITMDPDSLEKAPSLLKKLNQSFNLQFGVYASVVKTGEVRVGDTVELVE